MSFNQGLYMAAANEFLRLNGYPERIDFKGTCRGLAHMRGKAYLDAVYTGKADTFAQDYMRVINHRSFTSPEEKERIYNFIKKTNLLQNIQTSEYKAPGNRSSREEQASRSTGAILTGKDGALFNREEFAEYCKNLKPGRSYQLDGDMIEAGHAAHLYKNHDGTLFYYNSNLPSPGDYIYPPGMEKQLADQIFNDFRHHDKENFRLNIESFTHPKASPELAKADRLVADLNRNVNKNTDPVLRSILNDHNKEKSSLIRTSQRLINYAETAQGKKNLLLQNNKQALRDFVKSEQIPLPKVRLNAKTWAGMTPLHLAAMNNDVAGIHRYAKKINPNQGAARDASPLAYAAENNNVAAMQALLKHGARVDNQNPLIKAGHYLTHPTYTQLTRENTPLHCATASGATDAAKLLLQHGANPNLKDPQGRTPMHHAAISGNAALVQNLLEKGGKLSDNDAGENPAMIAAQQGNHEALEAMLDSKRSFNVNAKDQSGKTILHHLTEQGQSRLVEKLLKNPKIDINAKDKQGKTPLHNTVENNDQKSMDALLSQRKINPSPRDKMGRSPLHLAAAAGNKEATAKLLRRGANPKLRDGNGDTAAVVAANRGHKNVTTDILTNLNKHKATATPREATAIRSLATGEKLHAACKENNTHLAKNLIRQKGNPNLKLDGKTALHHAIEHGNEPLAQDLLKAGASPTTKDNEGKSALMLAAENNASKTLINQLINAGADVNETLPDGTTPLHLASAGKNPETVAALLNKGANPEAIANGYAPLHLAAATGNKEVLGQLLKAKPLPASNTPYLMAIAAKTKINPNQAMADGKTPLHLAAGNDNEAACKMLLAAGADPEAKQYRGLKPRDIAVGKSKELLDQQQVTVTSRQQGPRR